MRRYIDKDFGEKSTTSRRFCGCETLRLEAAYNNAAGFDEEDDELLPFFIDGQLPPTDKIARLRSSQVNAAMQNLLDAHSD